MRTRNLVQDVFLVSGLIVTLIVSLFIATSRKSLHVNESTQAHSELLKEDTFNNPIINADAREEINTRTDFSLIPESRHYVSARKNTLYTELNTEPLITNYTKSNVDITWISSAPLISVLKVGMHEKVLNRKFSDTYTTKPTYLHSVTLTSLTPGREYFFSGHSSFIDSFTFPKIYGEQPSNVRISGSIDNFSAKCIVRGKLEQDNTFATEVTSMSDKGNWLLDLSSIVSQDLTSYIHVDRNAQFTIDILCLSKKGVTTSGSITNTIGSFIDSPPIIRVE